MGKENRVVFVVMGERVLALMNTMYGYAWVGETECLHSVGKRRASACTH